MILRVCDICKKNDPDAKIKYKYKAKRFWWLGHEGGWEQIELCQECLDKIIKAEKENK
jgi:hypothetical protein